MKIFIEICRGNKWCYIGKIKYIIPENEDVPILCLAKGKSVDKNDLLSYIISGNHKEFAEGIGGEQLIEKHEIPTSGDDKCSKYILNTLEYNNAENVSYVLLSELLDIKKLEPFVLHGYVNKDLETYNKIASDIHLNYTNDGIFDITKYVIPNLDNINENDKQNYEFMYFQSKCVTHFINQIKDVLISKLNKDVLISKLNTDIFDSKNQAIIPTENIRIIFWHDE